MDLPREQFLLVPVQSRFSYLLITCHQIAGFSFVSVHPSLLDMAQGDKQSYRPKRPTNYREATIVRRKSSDRPIWLTESFLSRMLHRLPVGWIFGTHHIHVASQELQLFFCSWGSQWLREIQGRPPCNGIHPRLSLEAIPLLPLAHISCFHLTSGKPFSEISASN